MEALLELQTLVVGALSAFVLGAFKQVAEIVEVGLSAADHWLLGVLKELQPLVVAGLGALLPFAGNLLGVVEIPSAEIIAAAPASAVWAVVLRELMDRYVKPWFAVFD